MSVFRRALIATFGVVCLALGVATAPVSADPPPEAQNDGNGNSDSPGPGHGQGQSDGGGANAGGDSQGSSGQGSGGQGSGSRAGSSGSNPDGGGLDKPDCETTAEGCQGPAPRDGNNGCGNEAEPKSVRDDDNNGNCGGGREGDHESDGEGELTLAGAAAQGAWAGHAGKTVTRFLSHTAAHTAGEASEVVVDLDEPAAHVLGATVERDEAAGVDLENVELARSRASRSGARSLLAMTGIALLMLLALSLVTIGVGRLLRSVERGGS
jgi:hypothetical protein